MTMSNRCLFEQPPQLYNSATITMMSLSKAVFIFVIAAAAAAATDETVAATPSFIKRELKGDAEAEASYVSSYDGSIVSIVS